jgi:hypothetical protein
MLLSNILRERLGHRHHRAGSTTSGSDAYATPVASQASRQVTVPRKCWTRASRSAGDRCGSPVVLLIIWRNLLQAIWRKRLRLPIGADPESSARRLWGSLQVIKAE